MNILGLIPARGGSKGIPKKNIKIFNGKPLIFYSIDVALKSKYISHAIVSTDSREIADIAIDYGASVPFLRPSNISEDTTPDLPVMEHAINWFKNDGICFDYVVFLRPTNVFRVQTDVDSAIEKIMKSNYDSVRAISEVSYSPFWMKKIEGDKLVDFIDSDFSSSRRQDLPKVYQANGTFDVIRTETILNKKSRYGNDIGYVLMDNISGIDIDTPLDFEIAEYLYKKY